METESSDEQVVILLRECRAALRDVDAVTASVSATLAELHAAIERTNT